MCYWSGVYLLTCIYIHNIGISIYCRCALFARLKSTILALTDVIHSEYMIANKLLMKKKINRTRYVGNFNWRQLLKTGTARQTSETKDKRNVLISKRRLSAPDIPANLNKDRSCKEETNKKCVGDVIKKSQWLNLKLLWRDGSKYQISRRKCWI